VVHAVEGLSLTVQAGEIVALVGESGCGKSTVARTIVGLQHASGGRVIFDGIDIAGLRGADLRPYRRAIQLVHQDPYDALDPRLTVRAIVEEGLRIHRVPRGERAAIVRQALERVGLAPANTVLDRYPHQLSGGEKQRVGIARALASRPEFLVCDEALSLAGMKARDVDGVVLVGGTTRMPLVRQMVAEYFGRQPLTDINPEEVVAIGAAIQGAALEQDHFTTAGGTRRSTPLLLDVTPMSLGVQTVSGYYDVIIERNASIPCEVTRTFTTSTDNQTSVRLQIFQGESKVAAENIKLGEIELYGLRSGPRGQVELQVTFEIDTNGIVVVTARDRETGIEQATRIEVSAGYSPEEIAQMLERGVS
jgi:ABC-type lipoprotein export system ATPase subunit